MDVLDQAMDRSGAMWYIHFGSTRDPDMRYLTGFRHTDPFVYIRKKGDRGFIIVSQMEYQRATREAATDVITRAQAGLLEILKEEKDMWRALARMVTGLAQGIVLVPPSFPYAFARALEEYGEVMIDPGTVGLMRATKTENELGWLRAVQASTAAAMDLGIKLIAKSKPSGGILRHNGHPVTSELVRTTMHRALLDRGCIAMDTIVSCGEDTALPHMLGTGPLKPDLPIVIDIFPKDGASGYYADMTRTVAKGQPTDEINEIYNAVRDAQTLGISMIRPGVTGSSIHQAVVDFFSSAGYESNTEGFIHNLGHGVGLDVHELPVLGPSGGELVQGNVVTVEPGLYYPGIGGVRLEDMGAVTASGFENFTIYPREFILE